MELDQKAIQIFRKARSERIRAACTPSKVNSLEERCGTVQALLLQTATILLTIEGSSFGKERLLGMMQAAWDAMQKHLERFRSGN